MSVYLVGGLLLAYFGLLMLISSLQTNRRKSNEVFFLGSRRSPWVVVAIGMVGASLSGVTFVSVPGMVRSSDMLYMQTVLGFFVGYVLIAEILLPTYFRLRSPSIYAYLNERLGKCSYKTGASFFLLSKTIGAAARLYVVAIILQTFFFDRWHVPFWVTVSCIIVMIWLYTARSGIKTIVWTDMLQTFFLLTALVLIIVGVVRSLGASPAECWQTLVADEHFRLFEFRDWHSKQHFVKQFLSGIFIALVMTGLDQDMMQKNLSISNLKDAKRNIYSYGFAFIPVNFLFLSLGVLLIIFAARNGYALPEASDKILPVFATQGYLGGAVTIFFMLGIIAAAFSSADSALTALTTSLCVDILERPDDSRLRRRMHVVISLFVLGIIMIFKIVNSGSLIDALYTITGYTYGPLLGLFAFGLTTRRPVWDRATPWIALASPLICALIQYLSTRYLHYSFGYELLMLNGLLTFAALWASGRRQSRTPHFVRP
ncbi:MAG: sodium:solute symporter [Bacteroidales bacterium]|nr:sodium:solute symporter [Bacteroidales bacterium]